MKRLFAFLLVIAMFLTVSASAVVASDYEKEVIYIQENMYNAYFEMIREGVELEWSYLGDSDAGEFYNFSIKDGESIHDVIVLFGKENDQVDWNKFFFYLDDFTDDIFLENIFDLIMINIVSMEAEKSIDECQDIFDKFVECLYKGVFQGYFDEEYKRYNAYGSSLGIEFDEETQAICITADY